MVNMGKIIKDINNSDLSKKCKIKIKKLLRGKINQNNKEKEEEKDYNGYYVYRNPKDEYDIVFELQPSKGKVPKEAINLYIEVDKTAPQLKKIFKDDEVELKRNFEMLLTLAQGGLSGKLGNPKLGKEALDSLKYDILLSNGGKIKSSHIIGVGKYVIINIVIAIVLNKILEFYGEKEFTSYIILFIGAMIGSWLSVCIRKLEITFEDLANFEKDLMPFEIRLVFIGIVSIVFGMLVNNEIVTISFGELSLKTLFDSTQKTLLFGILCGIVDTKLAVNLYKKSETILNVKEDKKC